MGIGLTEATIIGFICCVTVVIPLLAIGAVVLYNRRQAKGRDEGSREGPER